MFSGQNPNIGGQGARLNNLNNQQYSSFQPSLQPQQNVSTSGYGQASMQQNISGYVQGQPNSYQPQQLQMQQTGFQSHQIPSFGNGQVPQLQAYQNGASNVSQISQQFQPQTQFQQVSEAPMLQPQPTGFAAMADSFKPTSPAVLARGRRIPKTQTGTKIPNIRLSFITAQDQAKFEMLFKSAAGNGQTLSGEKSRDLLLRSKLDGNSLSQIWTLADTTRSGQLHFPEFALAMYLCNLKIVGKQLPSTLPENIKNEVSSMVDIINFGVAEDLSESAFRISTSAPDLNYSQKSASIPAINNPQAHISDPNFLNPRIPGAQMQQDNIQVGFQQQQTGFQQPIQSGFGQIQQGLQSNPTSPLNNLGVTAARYSGALPPIPAISAMPTGFVSNQGLPSTQMSMGVETAPLNSQLTGAPGQWGLANTPATGLPNIDLLQSRMMPQQGRELGAFTTSGLQGNAVIPWAVTKEEKKRYDSVFKAWDGFGKGFIGGDVAIEVFGQSGLEKLDLERIWTLADHGNKGRLDIDEFSVAMHLIYRKLNGYPLPSQLPPELVPPSTRNFNDSIGAVKSLLHQESDFRKNSGANLLPQRTGVSYLKSHSFQGNPSFSNSSRKDATVFKNNDDDIGYKSSARRRVGTDSTSSKKATTFNQENSIEQLRKKIHEKQVLLDAIDNKDDNSADKDNALDRRDRRNIEELYRQIRRIQEDIDSHPNSFSPENNPRTERRMLQRQLQQLTDKLPEIASQVRKTEQNIADARLELFRLKDVKAHPESSYTIIGTGPGGIITESDRLKARAKAMMQQRSAALTGKKIDNTKNESAAQERLEKESLRIRDEKEDNERMVKDVEDSVREFSQSLYDSLIEGDQNIISEHDRKKWEEGLGVQDEVKQFIIELQKTSRSDHIRKGEKKSSSLIQVKSISGPENSASAVPNETTSKPSQIQSYATNANYSTPEDRTRYIKQQAEQRMAERLAALGIRVPTKPGETIQQRLEREKNERALKLRDAEEEDAKREAEQKARENKHDIDSKNPEPKSTIKIPPPPPSRKAIVGDTSKRKSEEQKMTEEKTQASQELEDNLALQEAELAKEREASASRLKALEEQVKAGKLKKEEEKRRRKAAQVEVREKESRLAAQRAEIEAAKARERELQKQLESIDAEESSSDDEGPEQVTLQNSADFSSPKIGKEEVPNMSPVSVSETAALISDPEASVSSFSSPKIPVTSPTWIQTVPEKAPIEFETKNPFFIKSTQASTEEIPVVQSNNPFFRPPTQEITSAQVQVQPTGNRNRVRPEDDEWSVVDSDLENDSSDDDGPGAGNARQLASILFGTMDPPRPISATGGASSPPITPTKDTMTESLPSKKNSSSPTTNESTPSSPNVPNIEVNPPPMPNLCAPPPPPIPNFSAPGAPPPPPPMPNLSSSSPLTASNAVKAERPSGFLGEIQMGKALKKTQTRDKSGASVSGRVLD
ncbi:Actin cytoskeleton-regulatory complex protein pan1 [Golovinomyces cichoracearum]|uniref:Actin cytoskeleton-regulatory complex protein pan1 n=1 Tax=Golovinomyces cichoracearum TaxID=62708 RepID=A0A420IYJ6_9PEZI|nr:Actin cytoskeleton-regulatory complex protein pan1 [Golovinomyces cichoracearum]